jgi:HSP20 family protein
MRGLIPWRSRGRGELTSTRSHPLAQFHDELEDMWGRFFGRWPMALESELEEQRFWDLDVQEKESEYIVRAEVPGFEPGDLDVQLTGDVLTIQAEKKQEEKAAAEGGHSERYAFYRRCITLPAGVKSDQVQAAYRNGVLELHVPRSEEVKPRRIPVEHQAEKTEPATTKTAKAPPASK